MQPVRRMHLLGKYNNTFRTTTETWLRFLECWSERAYVRLHHKAGRWASTEMEIHPHRDLNFLYVWGAEFLSPDTYEDDSMFTWPLYRIDRMLHRAMNIWKLDNAQEIIHGLVGRAEAAERLL
jgi:hypothetical protein